METFLAIFHYLMIFSTVALLLGEFLFLRLDLTGQSLKLLGRIDQAYGIFALLVVASGLMRVFLGPIPPATWGGNHAFWTKMVVFAAIGTLSVWPTLRYIAWGKAFAADGSLPDAQARKKAGRFVHIQLGLFVLMPILAVLMAEAAEKAG